MNPLSSFVRSSAPVVAAARRHAWVTLGWDDESVHRRIDQLERERERKGEREGEGGSGGGTGVGGKPITVAGTRARMILEERSWNVPGNEEGGGGGEGGGRGGYDVWVSGMTDALLSCMVSDPMLRRYIH